MISCVTFCPRETGTKCDPQLLLLFEEKLVVIVVENPTTINPTNSGAVYQGRTLTVAFNTMCKISLDMCCDFKIWSACND